MKAKINKRGVLILTPESESEYFIIGLKFDDKIQSGAVSLRNVNDQPDAETISSRAPTAQELNDMKNMVVD